MKGKKQILAVMTSMNGTSCFLTAREIYSDPELSGTNFTGLCHILRRMHNQRLVARKSKGNYKYPYRYQVTAKGLKRLEYYLGLAR